MSSGEAAQLTLTTRSDILLEAREIVVRFGGIIALDGASLTVSAGEVCGLIGPNGAGKTTMFDVISGIRNPQSGSVRLEGQDITAWNPTRRSRAGMYRTFQVVQMFGWLSVLDNVTAALDWEGGGGGFLADMLALPARSTLAKERRDRAQEALHECGLSTIADRPAGALPTGLARMVELARAIVNRPRILLLDEPTSGLDSAEAERLAACIESVTLRHHCGVLLVEHDMDFLMRQCHRVTVLDLGAVLTEGTPAEVRADERVRAAYLGS